MKINVTYKTVYRRVQCFLRALDVPRLQFECPVETDQLYIKGRLKGRERDSQSRSRGVSELIIVDSYLKDQIIDHYSNEYRGMLITYAPARAEETRLRLLYVEEHIEDASADPVRQRLQGEPRGRRLPQREDRVDAGFLVEEVPWEEASRYGVCDSNAYARSRRSSRNPRGHRQTS